jgi:heme exporter protein A
MTLQTSKLACVRGERELFSGLDVEVAAGESLWVQGPNGSGKTSLLRLLCGLSAPAAGAVHWCGRDIRRLREDFHRELLYIGHASGLKDDLTATENLLYDAHLGGRESDDDAARCALGHVGLARVSQLRVASLSQGQRKRVALARLYLRPVPPLLILDEPFDALDRNAADQLSATLSAHLAQGGIVVYTTHQSEALPPERRRVLDLQALAARRQRPC